MEYLVSKGFVPKSAAEVSAEDAARAKAIADAKIALESVLRAAMPEEESVSKSFQDIVNLARYGPVPGGWLLGLDDIRSVVQKLALEWHPGGLPPLEER